VRYDSTSATNTLRVARYADESEVAGTWPLYSRQSRPSFSTTRHKKNSAKPNRPAITKGLTLKKIQANQSPTNICKLLGKFG
jgi:hypothetical protein